MSISALVKKYGGLPAAAAALGYSSVQVLHNAIAERREFQLHCPVFLLTVLPLLMSRFVLPWHVRMKSDVARHQARVSGAR
jgi:hypothetical protein